MVVDKSKRATLKWGIVLLVAMLLLLPVQGFSLERVAAVSLRGDISKATPAKVTVADLERLPLVTYTTFNPYQMQRITYTGILLRDLVRIYAEPSCNSVTLTARDDYQVTFQETEWQRWDILLATRADGKKMSLSESGPVKIVMPYDTAEDIDHDIYTPKWIWLVASIEFKAGNPSR